MKAYLDIPTIEDCAALVEKHKCFSKSTQTVKGKTVTSFKYNFTEPAIYTEKFGLNLRGITFVDDKLVALPFPKFYNHMENESDYADAEVVDNVRCAYDKADGSLISFFKHGETIELKTMKSVYSEVAEQARKYWQTHRVDVTKFVNELLMLNMSPIFEYIGPENRIVIQYKDEDLVFLGARSMKTGEIKLPHELIVPETINTPKMFIDEDAIIKYLGMSGIEGVVCSLKNGLMVKVKTDEYCKLHRCMSDFSYKTVLKLLYNPATRMIEDQTDDMIAKLRSLGVDDIADEVLKIRQMFFNQIKERTDEANEFIRLNNWMSRKEIACTVFQSHTRQFASNVMAVLDDKKDCIVRSVYTDMMENGIN